MQTNGKLAGALSRHGHDDPGQPRNYILAITRRCLNWLNEALAGLQEIGNTFSLETSAAARQEAADLTAGIHALRQAISDLRQELIHGTAPGNSSEDDQPFL